MKIKKKKIKKKQMKIKMNKILKIFKITFFEVFLNKIYKKSNIIILFKYDW